MGGGTKSTVEKGGGHDKEESRRVQVELERAE